MGSLIHTKNVMDQTFTVNNLSYINTLILMFSFRLGYKCFDGAAILGKKWPFCQRVKKKHCRQCGSFIFGYILRSFWDLI